MAIFTPSESPAVIVREIDLTGVVPNTQSTTGAYVGNFRWGPVEEVTLVGNEAELVNAFGSPSDSNAVDFLSAEYFLRYSGNLNVVRMIDSDAVSATDSDFGVTVVVKNEDNFAAQQSTLDSANGVFVARYPGALGNAIRISVCPVSTADSAFDSWTYAGEFDAAPGTSSFAASIGASNDEIHVVVADRTGEITGTPGSILETFPFLSVASNAKRDDGTSNYMLDVLNSASNFVYQVGWGSGKFGSNFGAAAIASRDFLDASVDNVYQRNFARGVNSSALGADEYANGFALMSDKDTVQLDFLIAPSMVSRVSQTTVVNDLVSIAQATRKDCVVVASPARNDIINNNSPVTDAVATANTLTNSSYLVLDNNFLKVYDKYNDKYRWIPASSSTAGIMAATDLNAAPWFSPAGARRGQYLGITSLAYTPTKAERDTLYKAGINPIANLPGQGVLLYGDKTKLNRPSAFDRINVRRLFLVMERAIAIAARNTLFEFNDEFTRAEFVNIVEPFLREIKGRRGITDFRVVCDETNNTPAVIDRNEFIASIFVKPARSINYVTLNFVAVRTGVDFEEVVGTV